MPDPRFALKKLKELVQETISTTIYLNALSQVYDSSLPISQMEEPNVIVEFYKAISS
jgi:hypothetical protein